MNTGLPTPLNHVQSNSAPALAEALEFGILPQTEPGRTQSDGWQGTPFNITHPFPSWAWSLFRELWNILRWKG